VLDDALLAFIGSSIRSVWSLELLLLLRRRAPAAISVDDLVLELRGSKTVVLTSLKHLEHAGLIAHDSNGFQYAPKRPEAEALVEALAQAHADRPVALIDAIHAGPSKKLQNFADAFRFKDKDKDK